MDNALPSSAVVLEIPSARVPRISLGCVHWHGNVPLFAPLVTAARALVIRLLVIFGTARSRPWA